MLSSVAPMPEIEKCQEIPCESDGECGNGNCDLW